MIRGELVNLRAVERPDATILHRWLNDPATIRGWGLSAPAISLAEVQRQVEGWLGKVAALGRPVGLVVEPRPLAGVHLAVDRSHPCRDVLAPTFFASGTEDVWELAELGSFSTGWAVPVTRCA